jgi:spore coat polysaccharide biosynthesis predicted glycosyltransferase SpsG
MIYELAALGLPTILVAQADNQLLISEYMSRQGLMKYIGDWKYIELNTIKSEVEALLSDYDRRNIESNKLKNTIDRNGAMNAAYEIMEYYQQRRHQRIGCVLHKDSRD